EGTKIVRALSSNIKTDGPGYPAQRQRPPGYAQGPFDRWHVVEGCVLTVPYASLHIRQREFVGGADFQHDDGVLIDVVADNRHHGHAPRHFVEVRPWPLEIERAKRRFVAGDDAKCLGDDR